MPPAKSPLQIQTGVVRRVVKELAMYREEVVQGEATLARLTSAGADDASQARKVLDESRGMVTNTHDRLEAALKELRRALDAAGAGAPDADAAEAREWIAKADAALAG